MDLGQIAFNQGFVKEWLEKDTKIPPQVLQAFQSVSNAYDEMRELAEAQRDTIVRQKALIDAQPQSKESASTSDAVSFDWRDIDVCYVQVGHEDSLIVVGAVYLGEGGEPVLETPPFSVRVTGDDLAAAAAFIVANRGKIPSARSSAL